MKKTEKQKTIQEYSLKKKSSPIQEEILIHSSIDANATFRTFWNQDNIPIVEETYAMYMNRRNKVLGYYYLGKGSATNVIMDVKMVAIHGVLSLASYCILAHNHPSGSLIPSDCDVNVTREIKQGLQLLKIKLLDHLILSETSYRSMADENDIDFNAIL